MRLVAEAQSVFEGLPADLRDRFGNDPARLLEFVHDPRHLEESVSLGLIDPSKLPQPEPVPESPTT